MDVQTDGQANGRTDTSSLFLVGREGKKRAWKEHGDSMERAEKEQKKEKKERNPRGLGSASNIAHRNSNGKQKQKQKKSLQSAATKRGRKKIDETP